MLPNRKIRDQIQSKLLGAVVTYPTPNGDSILVRIEQLAWHKSKLVVVGHLTNGDKLVRGERFLGTSQKILEHTPALFDGIPLSEDDLDYLSQPWDAENGTTSHEISVRETRRLNSLLE